MSDPGFTVDAADLIDAVTKAAVVSPSRGAAFVISAGILFELQGEKVLVKATDAETKYRAEIPALAPNGSPEPFRVPSTVVSGWLSRLPTSANSTVTFVVRPEQAKVEISCGKSNAKFTLIQDDTFITIDAFDPSSLLEVPDLAGKLRRVSWACGSKPPLDGIHIDGSKIVAVGHGGAAWVEAQVPVTAPITAQFSAVSMALRGHSGSVSLGVEGTRLHLMPDAVTQYSTSIYAQPFPNVDLVTPSDDALNWTEIDKTALSQALGRINALAGQDKEIGSVDILVDGDQLFCEATVDEYGRVEEDLGFNVPHESDSLQVRFNPRLLQHAIDNCGGSISRIGWQESNIKPIKITDGHGYTVVLMPMRPR